jgi:hypothetical protein
MQLLLLILSVVGCNRKLDYELPRPDLYPLIPGKQRVYEVFERNFTTADTLDRYYLKRELTGGTELDLRGRTTYRLENWVADTARPNDWQFEILWTQYRDNDWAERIEGNVRYVVLQFPVIQESPWNGNIFNSEGDQFYQYLNLDTTLTLGGRTYTNCVFVLQRRELSLLRDQYAYEIYAPGVGKLVRYDRNLRFDLEANNQLSLSTDSYIYEERLRDQNYLD